MNGDRVQSEYYLQFADHYFRVIADQRLRQEEQRARRDDRWQDGGEGGERFESDDAGEFATDSDFPSFDQPVYTRREREDRPRRTEREDRPADEDAARGDSEGGDEEPARDNPYEPNDNPFVRDNRETRGSRGLRPRRTERPRREERSEEAAASGLDPSLLPPAIGAGREEGDGAEPEAKPRRGRPRKPRTGDDAGEALESVN